MRLSLNDSVCVASSAHNEDRSGLAGRTAWVLDGATDVLEPRLLPGPSDAAWFADALNVAFYTHLPHQPERALLDLVAQATADVADRFHNVARRRPEHGHEKPSAAGIILRLEGETLELIGLGDCTVLALRNDGGSMDLFRGSAPRDADPQVQAAAKEARAKRPDAPQHGPHGIRSDLMPMLRAARSLMNAPGGYGVFSIDLPEPGAFAQTRVRAGVGDRFVLATDGFMRLVDLFGAYTVASLGDAIVERGVVALTQELRALEGHDLEGLDHPRAKARDDATALVLEVIE